MKNDSDLRESVTPPAPPERSDEKHAKTRRTFLGDAHRKALYVAPLVFTLAASPEQAWASGAPPSGTCVPSGMPCATDEECCSGNCVANGMMCQML
jgi:hypothetical protein